MASPQRIATPVTDLLKIKHPVILAGMGVAAGPKLAAAVSNAGGLGVIGGYGYTPEALREQIRLLKSYLADPGLPFGVDLLIPQVGGNARKTNYDYNKGKLDILIDIMIEMGCRVMVSAVGMPPSDAVKRIHDGGMLYMNMIGHPKHVQKCLDNDVDILCAQGGEGGGHTGDIPLSVLVPTVAGMIKGQRSSYTGRDVQLVAAGGMYNGNSLAGALMLGASAIWVGTRFLLCDESGASAQHQEAVRTAGWEDNIRTCIFSGRPMRVKASPYIREWEESRKTEQNNLLARGLRPVDHDIDNAEGDRLEQAMDHAFPTMMGKVSAVVTEKKSARAIVDEMVSGAIVEKQQTLEFHSQKLTPDRKHPLVTEYFVRSGNISNLNIPSDFKALCIAIKDGGALGVSHCIDCASNYYNRGRVKPHSSIVFNIADPVHSVSY